VADDGASDGQCPTLKAPIGLVADPKLIDLLIGQGIGVEKQSMNTWRIDTDAISGVGPGSAA
jgi:hypothetical protein